MKFRAQASATIRPVATLPVNASASTLSIMAAPVLPSPAIHWKTPASSGTSARDFCNGLMKRGVTSLGFTSTAQPAINAGIESSIDSRSGKFHGLITPTSP